MSLRKFRHGKNMHPTVGGGIAMCEPCGKVLHPSRKEARIAARRVRGGDRPRAYPCPANPAYWHLGELAPTVRQGRKTREQWYRP